jgi:Protein of unknown function (DUF2934)
MAELQECGDDAIRRRAYRIWQDAGSPHGGEKEHWRQAEAEEAATDAAELDDKVDEASADSFPASDPPALGGVDGPRKES